MPLYYLTGISGSGKSTALAELRQRGYEAYDVDEAGPVTAKWHNNDTGFVHPKSSIKKEDRTPEFLTNHSWKVPPQEVEVLAKLVGTKPVFLGGSIANEVEIKDLCSTVFALAIDDDILMQRLFARTNNDWGKSSHELELTLTVNHDLDKKYEKYGYVVINASQTIDTIIAKILSHIHDN